MSRKKKNDKDLMRGFKGWERQYIKKSISYGHLDSDSKQALKGSNKQRSKYVS